MSESDPRRDWQLYIRQRLREESVRWTVHAKLRMESRSIPPQALFESIDSIEVIEEYPDDKYLPSYLVRGIWRERVFHAHVAVDVAAENVRIVTMYWPDSKDWDADSRNRRQSE